MLNSEKRSYLRPSEVAGLLGVSHMSIHRWVKDGDLAGSYTPGRRVRIERSAVRRFCEERKIPVPPALGRNDIGKLRILVVDDDESILRAMQRGLTTLDTELVVHVASSGLDGLLMVGLLKPDAVILDAAMPRFDGIDACLAIKKNPETRSCVIVGMSGRASEYKDAFMRAGAAAFLGKPVNISTVTNTLRELLGARPHPG